MSYSIRHAQQHAKTAASRWPGRGSSGLDTATTRESIRSMTRQMDTLRDPVWSARCFPDMDAAEREAIADRIGGTIATESRDLRAALASLRGACQFVIRLAAVEDETRPLAATARDANQTTELRARDAARLKLHGLHHVALLSSRNAREVLAVA